MWLHAVNSDIKYVAVLFIIMLYCTVAPSGGQSHHVPQTSHSVEMRHPFKNVFPLPNRNVVSLTISLPFLIRYVTTFYSTSGDVSAPPLSRSLLRPRPKTPGEVSVCPSVSAGGCRVSLCTYAGSEGAASVGFSIPSDHLDLFCFVK